jgi:hypothetical protein
LLSCSSRDLLPKVRLLFGGFWVEILPQHYVSRNAKNECRLEFNRSPDNTWVIGLPVLKGFYSAFNLATKSFALGPLKTSSKLSPTPGITPSDEMPSIEIPQWALLFLMIVCAIILVILISLLIKFLICKEQPQHDGKGILVLDETGTAIETSDIKKPRASSENHLYVFYL